MMGAQYITIHCSASRPKQAATQTAKDIDAMHRARGWRKIGYHWFIRHDGTIEQGRKEHELGAHVSGHNRDNIGICYAGGLDENGKPADTRTEAQRMALRRLVAQVQSRHPATRGKDRVKGHRDWSPDRDGDGKVERHEWLKDCPCFDVESEL